MSLKFWNKKEKKTQNTVYVTSRGITASWGTHRDPVIATLLNKYNGQVTLSLIDAMMSSIPLCNAAVTISSILTGFPMVIDTGGDRGLRLIVDDYIKKVPLNPNYSGVKGLRMGIYQLLFSAIAKGYGVGMTITNRNKTEVEYLKICDPNYFIWSTDIDNQKKLHNYENNGEIVEDANNIHLISYRNKYGDPSGTSIFESVPFFARLLMYVSQAFTDQALRTGIPIYLVTYTEPDEEVDPGSLATSLKGQLDSAILSRESGYGINIWAGNRGGEAKVEVVGEGAKNIADLEINKITAYEQIITASGLSSQMFALFQWNQNYQMSELERHKTIAVIQHYRNGAEPVVLEPLQYAATVYKKNPAKISIKEWPPIDLIAIDALAEARLDNAKAREIELMNLQTEILLGLNSIEDEQKRMQEKVRNFQTKEMAAYYARKWEPKVY